MAGKVRRGGWVRRIKDWDEMESSTSWRLNWDRWIDGVPGGVVARSYISPPCGSCDEGEGGEKAERCFFLFCFFKGLWDNLETEELDKYISVGTWNEITEWGMGFVSETKLEWLCENYNLFSLMLNVINRCLLYKWDGPKWLLWGGIPS